MKKKLLLVLFSIALPTGIYSQTECSCGTHAEGIIDYTVVAPKSALGEPGCCTGLASGNTYISKFKQNERGVWEVVDVVKIEASEAQKKCCESA